MNTITPSRLLSDAAAWAREAGKIQLGYFRSGDLEVHNKLNDADIVTAADKASESVIIGHIRDTYPGHAILSEESGEHQGHDGYRWVIDPLDGTTNFNSGLPLFAVSIGIEHCGTPVAGVVYIPYLDEMFTAIQGNGAFLNGRPIHCSDEKLLSRSVVSTGFPVDKNTSPDNNLDNLSRMLPLVRGLRRLGSAAIDICYVAAGYLEAYWEMNLHLWDVSAALLIASEAGACHTRFRPDRGLSVLVAAPAIFPQILQRLSSTPASTASATKQ